MNKLGYFLNKDIKVKAIENCTIKNFFERGDFYCDCKIGCDLCEQGVYIGLKTTYGKLRDEDDFFLLNDIEILKKDILEEDLLISTLFCSNDTATIAKIMELHKKLKETRVTKNEYSLSDQTFKTNYLVSTNLYKDPYTNTLKNIAEIISTYICATCYSWIQISQTDDIKKSNFVKTNPLKLFWKDVLKYYILSDLEFESIEDKTILEQFVK